MAIPAHGVQASVRITGDADLKHDAIGLPGALVQSIAQISPMSGIFYTIAFTTTYAGAAAPLTYLAACLVCLTVAVPLHDLARHLPSAGGVYTYISAGIGPQTGFLTGWVYALMMTVAPAALASFAGAIIHDELAGKYGIGIPWWTYSAVILAVCFACAYRGISISSRFLVVMTCFEVLVGLGLAVTGLVNPGPGGLNIDGFNPAGVTNGSGFLLAVVLSMFAFTGFESAAVVGDESRDPCRIIPRAIFGSLALIGAFYVVTAWGLQIGWGTDHLEELAISPIAPAFVLADRLWNGASIVVLIALANSGLAVCIACTTSATRTVFGIARTGALPAWLARVHPGHRTPVAAVLLQSGVALGTCLAVGIPLGPYNLFHLLGAAGTFVYIPILILMNIAAFRFFRRRFPAEFSACAHVVAPVISTAALLLIAGCSLYPLPDFPIRIAPVLAMAFAGAGVIVLFVRNLQPGKTGWMAKAGQLPDVEWTKGKP
ncbi:APC family permease [Kribbella antibiotica]|nr:APC family permease [Kribbella antibiotica]